ncbi:MAG: ATP-binding cassette domain-containing protein [Pilosibacter sp.]
MDENGMVMSGGEMQRIAIARIMAQKYKLVILDEATSNIDIMSEKKIFDELKKMGNTVILITHKISNIEYANKILVLQNGRIVENGTPDELIREKGIYYKMIMENERR